MYAVIRTGGKQYRVAEGDTVEVERLDAEPGKDIDLEEVLMITDGDVVDVGTPLLDGAKVTARVLENGRGAKIRVVKFKRRKSYRKQMGHRQNFTRLEITKINKGS